MNVGLFDNKLTFEI